SCLDGCRDDVADPGIAPVRAADHADAQELARPRVVGHLQSCLLLDHYFAFSTISASRQRLVFESGLVSTTRTTSPMPAEFAPSWACSLLERRTTFLYLVWIRTVWISTTIVLSPLSDTTTPRRSWRRPGVLSGLGVPVIGSRSFDVVRAGFECLWRSARGSRFR